MGFLRRRIARYDLNVPESRPSPGPLPQPRVRCDPMPTKFNVLARYNSDRALGLVHTAEYDAQMAALQAEFDQWAASAHG